MNNASVKTATKYAILASLTVMLASTACSTMKGVLAMKENDKKQFYPISNPFGGYYAQNKTGENIILRTKKGDRAIEVEFPSGSGEMSDFSIPMSPGFSNSNGRNPASSSGGVDPEMDQSFKERPLSITDREIIRSLPTTAAEDAGLQREVESGMGLIASEDNPPAADRSYLAAMDHIKQLYKNARYEAGLLEIDEMLRAYPTDPTLYQMRGTLLDRVGRADLAIKSWTQALRFDPNNPSLTRFIERKQQKRALASGAAATKKPTSEGSE